MAREDPAQRAGELILQCLQFAVGGHRGFFRCGGFIVVQRHEFVGDFLNLHFFPFLQPPTPKCLERCAVSGTFADFQRHDFSVEDVRHDLPP